MEEEVEYIDIELFPKQVEFMDYEEEREVLFEAGIGAGKSTVGAIWLVEQCLEYDNSKWLMVSRDHGQLEDATDAEFYFVLTELYDLEEGVDFKKTKKPLQYRFFATNAIVNGRSAINYDSAFRGPNYWGAWGDEVDFWKPQAVEKLRGRIRRGREQIRFTSSPDGFNHVHKDFYVNKVGPIVKATTHDNPTLTKAYIESLRNTYSPRLFEQEVMAKRLMLNVGAVYSEFSREKHGRDLSALREYIIEEKKEIYFFLDYNIAHYCGVYLYWDEDRRKLSCIDEEHLEYQGTRVMAPTVRAKYPDNPIIVCGDSTGNNKKDVAIEQVNYAIFKEHGLMTQNFKNPPVKSRIIAANSNIHHNRFDIDPDTCPNTTRDLEMVAWKEDGSEIDKSDITLSHASDGLTYGMWHFMPISFKKKSRTIQF